MRLMASVLAASLFAQPISPVASSQTASPLPTLRTGVRLVVVDVVVTDRNKQPVHGLQAGDFQLFENNTSQTFRSFEEHVALTDAAAGRFSPMPKLPPGVFTNYAPGPTDGPLNVLLLDRLNTPLDSQMQMQAELAKYVDRMKPGTRIAVFGLTDHLIYLQNFTSDPAILKAIVSGKFKAKASALSTHSVSEGGAFGTAADAATSGVALMSPGTPEAAAAQETADLMTQYQSQVNSFQNQLRAKYTLDAMNLLARYLAGFPGRKNLVWFSGSFPVNIMPDMNVAEAAAITSLGSDPLTGFNISSHNPFAAVASAEKEFRITSALLSKSQVSVYPVQVAGLTTMALFDAGTAAPLDARYVRAGSAGVLADVNSFQESNFSNNSTMFMLADDTGGKATINTNDLAGAVQDSIANGSNYYTIAYSPTNTALDGSFRTILVKLRESGYKVAYRRGYFAQDTDEPVGDIQSSATKRQPAVEKSLAGTLPTNTMQLALTHGGPASMQMIFSARVQPVGTGTELTLAKGTKPGKKPGKGPFRSYRVDYAVDPNELRFTTGPDGVRHAKVEFVVYTYDADGILVTSAADAINVNMGAGAYKRMERVGLPFTQHISVPETKGDFYLRIAMHDVTADHVGAIEVPVSSVRSLGKTQAAMTHAGAAETQTGSAVKPAEAIPTKK